MRKPATRSIRVLAVCGCLTLGSLTIPAAASAAPASDDGLATVRIQLPEEPPPPPPPPFDWYHPEWGPGWNNGYPAAGWTPPENWTPPQGWTNPSGWEPPPSWRYPVWWCSGPWRDWWHLRCR
jgi:hypothetical protein